MRGLAVHLGRLDNRAPARNLTEISWQQLDTRLWQIEKISHHKALIATGTAREARENLS